ncbi:hypothetical protein L596_024104 [Steinernema carpocapsae]|uniref:CUB domain-containing protein n=1 Tax=Steinernema carpocapsae TaxID=34508 RepID=A0A4U5MFP9_STECR|nr:hypothetical protein L596_024104 [Steinernema carpocapsae]
MCPVPGENRPPAYTAALGGDKRLVHESPFLSLHSKMVRCVLVFSLLVALSLGVVPKRVRTKPQISPLNTNFIGCPENNDFYYNGVITSPLYPQNYPNNDQCYYFINAKQGSVVQFNFTHFDVETCCDYVTIYDGRTEKDPILVRFGGHNRTADIPTGPLFSSTRYALMTFTSDNIVNKPGFAMTYSSVYTASPCNRDIVLMVNGLASVGTQANFVKQLHFIADSLISSWTVGQNTVRVVVNLQIDKEYAILFDASQSPDTHTLRETILSLVEYVPDVTQNNSTDFESLFHYASADIASNHLGERSGIGRVVIMFVAQNPTVSQDFNAATEFAHNMRDVDDTKVITVAMGTGIDVAKVGSLSYGEGFYFGADYANLDSLANKINAAICKPEASKCGV